MRKLGSIFILSVYLLLSVGVAKSTHFCMGREHHSALFSFESKKCACSVYQRSNVKTCCEDETELVKIENDQVHSSATDAPQTDWAVLPIIAFDYAQRIVLTSPVLQVVSYDLPPPKVPIYQLGCSWKVVDLMV
ncbi:MAG: HYC_CC_PP family protein [Cyclobacteriaceae bacterium]